MIEDLARRFVYKKDKVDTWRILMGAGEITGDCEDFSLTLVYLESGRSKLKTFWNLLICRYVLWHCTYKETEGHMVVYHKGKWADNIQRRWVDDLGPKYNLKFPYGPLAIPVYFLKKVMR